MSLEPLVVGSIKDRIVCSVWALGELATRAHLGQAVECNSSLLSIALEGLERDGYMHLTEAGHYVLHEDLQSSLNPSDRAALAAAERTEIHQSESETMATTQTRQCKVSHGWGCDKTMPIAEFYGKSAKCRRCTLNRQKELKAARTPSAASSPAKRTSKPNSAEPAVADEFVIPAAGQIHCRVLDAGAGAVFVLQQGDDQVVCSLEQLQVLRDWADARIKKAMAQ